MSLMAAVGEITPMPTAAIFADTQAEPKSVYTWLDWLEKQLPFPVIRVCKGSLEKNSLSTKWSSKNKKVTLQSIPAFLKNTDGSLSLLPRQCTRDFKIDPITKRVNQFRREHGNTQAILWIGISIDEIYRLKEHRNAPRICNRHPLVNLRFDREDCKRWMAKHNFPEPPRSACFFCPYHNNAEWRRLRDDEPAEFSKAIRYELDLKKALSASTVIAEPFLHRSLVPLDQVDFSTEEERGQLNLFQNECEGLCGV